MIIAGDVFDNERFITNTDKVYFIKMKVICMYLKIKMRKSKFLLIELIQRWSLQKTVSVWLYHSWVQRFNHYSYNTTIHARHGSCELDRFRL